MDDFDDPVLESIENQKPFLNDNIGMEDLQLNEDIPKTNMTITGKLNPEDDTIFLKVQIADKEGNSCRFISIMLLFVHEWCFFLLAGLSEPSNGIDFMFLVFVNWASSLS